MECTFEQNAVTDSEGKAVAISTGIQVEAKMVVKEKRLSSTY